MSPLAGDSCADSFQKLLVEVWHVGDQLLRDSADRAVLAEHLAVLAVGIHDQQQLPHADLLMRKPLASAGTTAPGAWLGIGQRARVERANPPVPPRRFRALPAEVPVQPPPPPSMLPAFAGQAALPDPGGRCDHAAVGPSPPTAWEPPSRQPSTQAVHAEGGRGASLWGTSVLSNAHGRIGRCFCALLH